MMQLNNLEKLKKARKRVGRGGDRGGTSGQGHKGQNARSGGGVRTSFEGGQMPLSRRLPKRGFTNRFRRDVQIINLVDLETKFESKERVDRDSLTKRGILKGKGTFLIKVLGQGTLSKELDVCVDLCSKSAKEAIEKAGGKIQLSKEIQSGGVAS